MVENEGDFETKVDLKDLQINASDEMLKGCFANVIRVAFGPEDFRMDFLYVWENGGTLSARVMLTPGHMKRLQKVIGENIKKYEDKFGPISEKNAEG